MPKCTRSCLSECYQYTWILQYLPLQLIVYWHFSRLRTTTCLRAEERTQTAPSPPATQYGTCALETNHQYLHALQIVPPFAKAPSLITKNFFSLSQHLKSKCSVASQTLRRECSIELIIAFRVDRPFFFCALEWVQKSFVYSLEARLTMFLCSLFLGFFMT